jgi:hypothetical protein
MNTEAILVSVFYLLSGSSFTLAIYFYIIRKKDDNGFASKLINEEIALGFLFTMLGNIVLFQWPNRYLIAAASCIPFIVFRFIFIKYIFKQLKK